MSKTCKLFLGMLALSLLLSGCAPKNVKEPAGSAAGSGAVSGSASVTDSSAAPVAFEGTDLEGNAVTSDIFSQSRLTMINVWATYCNPCLSEMPSLGELAAEYDTADFQVIGIVSDVLEGQDQALVESLVEQTGASYPHLLLNESIHYGLLTNVAAVPTTFFIDEDGIVLDVVIGAMKKTAWEEKINALLEGL